MNQYQKYVQPLYCQSSTHPQKRELALDWMQPHTLSCRGSVLGRLLAQTLALNISHSFCSMRDLLVSSISPSLACGIGQGSVVNSLAFFPTLTLRVERGAAAAKAQSIRQQTRLSACRRASMGKPPEPIRTTIRNILKPTQVSSWALHSIL